MDKQSWAADKKTRRSVRGKLGFSTSSKTVHQQVPTLTDNIINK